MIQVINAWRSSFEMVVPLLQLAIKTMLQMYWLVITQLWWFLLLGGIIFVAPFQPVFYITWIVLWTFFLIIFARPSIGQKNFWYCAEYIGYSFFALGFFWVGWYLWYFHPLAVFFLIPYACVTMLFIGDSYYNPSEIVRVPLRAAQLSLAIAPWYMTMSVVIWLQWYFWGGYAVLYAICAFIEAPFCIALCSRLYSMAIHKEYKEYYERCW